MMNSNATLLNKERGRALRRSLDNMFVSFDASSPDLFEQQRVGINARQSHRQRLRVRQNAERRKFPVGAGSSFDGYVQRTEWLEQFEIKIMWKRPWSTRSDTASTPNVTEIPMGNTPRSKALVCAAVSADVFQIQRQRHHLLRRRSGRDGCWRRLPLHEIWHNQAYTEIRRLHADDEYYRMEMCRKCYLLVS